MQIESLRIQNFRGITDAKIELDGGLTVLVGANNSGKTTVLDALKAVLSYRRGAPSFLDTDFRAESPAADVRDAKPIELTLRIGPSTPPKFVSGELGRHPDIETGGRESVRLRLRAEYSNDLRQIETTLLRLGTDNKPLDHEGFGAFPWRELVLFRAFGADRDLQRGMGGRWSDWSQLLSQVRPSPEVLEEAVTHFAKGSSALVDGTEKLGEIADALRPVGEALGMPGSDVKLSATAQDPAEILQNVMVEMRLPGASRGFNAERHGHGTQGALLFAFYRLQVEWILKSGPPGASPVLTVEEPETHLHPTAQRSMAAEIGRLPGQVVATSHSPEFVEHVKGSVVLLRAVDGNTSLVGIDAGNRWLRHHPRAVFARCVIITEGFEERMLPVFSQALGLQLHEAGIEVVNAGGQGNILKIWEIFGPAGLGLPIVSLADADNDDDLRSFLKKARPDPVPTAPDELIRELRAHDYFTCAFGECLEQELARCAGSYVDQAFSDDGEPTFEAWRRTRQNDELKESWQKKLNATVVGDLRNDTDARAYRLTKRKEGGPAHVARLMTNDGKDATLIPPRFRDALKRAVARARGPVGRP